MIRKDILKGWSLYPAIKASTLRPERERSLIKFMKKNTETKLARGGSTSYGDSSINSNGVNINTLRFNKILSYDNEHGIIRCQSGVRIIDLLSLTLTKGWILNITPGTSNATIGGCIACDSHGKNWSAGSFGNYVLSLNLMIEGGKIIYCDRNTNEDLFLTTIGGLGTTGIIIDTEIKLKKIKSSSMNVKTVPFRNLKECFSLQEESIKNYEYIFCWIDSRSKGKDLGRGVMQVANHSEDGGLSFVSKQKNRIPFYMPNFFINKLSVRIFNSLYYYKAKIQGPKKITKEFFDFFYPLDSVGNWNHLYGKKGFIEYQCVIPKNNAYEVISKIISIISSTQLGSFISAIKPLIKSEGYLSFPIDGYTLVIDFKYNEGVFNLLEDIDIMVAENGGRVYLAKDARLNEKNFRLMYKDALSKFLKVHNKYKINNHFTSNLFKRLNVLK